MPCDAKEAGAGFSLRSVLGELLAIPGSFLGGLLVGLVAPVAAVAGIVGGVYLFTKKVPFFSHLQTDEASGERSYVLRLMPPDEAREAFEARKIELQEAWSRIRAELAEIEALADAETD